MIFKDGIPTSSDSFEDEKFKIKDDADPSKSVTFDLSEIPHSTKISLKVPYASGTLCLHEIESTARAAADSVLASNLSDEITARLAADSALSLSMATPSDIVISNSSTSTTSTSDVLLPSMSLTPTVAGDLIVRGHALVSNSSNGGVVTVSLYVNGVLVSGTSQAAATNANRYCNVSISAKIPYATGSIQLRWKVSSGTGTALGRSLSWEKKIS